MTYVLERLEIIQINYTDCLIGWLMIILLGPIVNSHLLAHKTHLPLHFLVLNLIDTNLFLQLTNYRISSWQIITTLRTSGGQWLTINPNRTHVVGVIRLNLDSHSNPLYCHLAGKKKKKPSLTLCTIISYNTPCRSRLQKVHMTILYYLAQ